MNRQERRARMKKLRIHMLRGGKKTPSPQVDTSQPAGLLAKKLDGFLRDQTLVDPRLDPMTVLAVLLQMTAGLIIESGAPEEEVFQALETFVARERTARAPTEPARE